MLVIRMQRTGRKGHAMFRVVVQDSRRTPTSGKIVASLGSYDPHAKSVQLNKERAQFYVDHGAQPSERVAVLLKSEGIKLPKWVSLPGKKERDVRNPEKRRSTRPPEPEAPAEEETAPTAEETPATEPASEEAPAAEAAADEPEEAQPAEEAPAEAVEENPSESTPEAGEESA